MHKLYIIDDEPSKRSWLKPLLDVLGNGWEAGFKNSADALKKAHDLLAAARSGVGNAVLLDIYMDKQVSVTEELVALIRNTPEGSLGDSYYRANDDKAYRLACYIYAICLINRTPVFSISNLDHPETSLRSYDDFGKGLPKPAVLLWPKKKANAKSVRLLRKTMSENADRIRSQMNPYSAFKARYKLLADRLKEGESWPPHGQGSLFPSGDWHRLGLNSSWAALASINKDLVERLNTAICELCSTLPKTSTNFPTGMGGVEEYWPLAAAKGLHDGKISLRFIEWLLGLSQTSSSSYLDGFKAHDDKNNAELVAALCLLASHPDRNGKCFTVEITRNDSQIVFTFTALTKNATSSTKAVTDINTNPHERSAQSGRNGNPGVATEARYKLEAYTKAGNFRAKANKEIITITGTLELDQLR